MKKFIFVTAILVLSFSSAHAADGQPTLVKGSKSYQARTITPSAEKNDDAVAPAQINSALVEPAAGADVQSDMSVKPDTTRMLQQSMKLPRKN